MKIMLLGPPGVGKGTQAKLLAASRGLAHIATGDMLRAEVAQKTALGLAAQQFMNKGELVPDDLIIEMTKSRLQAGDGGDFVLDGFPRTVEQAEALEKAGVFFDAVIELEVDDEAIVARLGGRRVHPASGRVYHTLHNPPATEGRDDETGEPLAQREDDKPQTVRKRLAVYHAQTAPLLAHYRDAATAGGARCARILADGDIADIQQRIAAEIEAVAAARG